MTSLLAVSGLAFSEEYREITWDDLMPKGWDPSDSFKDMDDLSDAPDSDPRVKKLYDRMREVWDNAPGVPALSGKKVRLPGYLVPLDEVKGGIVEFLLVPYFGACIHTPPPPANQIIQVKSVVPIKGFRTMDAVWVNGTLTLKRSDSSLGISGYSMAANSVTRYKEPKTRR